MVKLILSDVDGTLLARGEGTFDDSVFEVIDRLYERGIHFAAASGRRIQRSSQALCTCEGQDGFCVQ